MAQGAGIGGRAAAHPRARRGEEGGGGGGAVVDELARDGLQLDGRRRLARRRRGERALAERRRRREARERRSRSGSRRLEELLEAVQRDEAARRRPADEQRELLGARPAHRAHERRVGLRVAHDAHAAVERPVGVPRVHVAADGGTTPPRPTPKLHGSGRVHLALAQRAAQLLRQLARRRSATAKAVGPLQRPSRAWLGTASSAGGILASWRAWETASAQLRSANGAREERGEELGASVGGVAARVELTPGQPSSPCSRRAAADGRRRAGPRPLPRRASD